MMDAETVFYIREYFLCTLPEDMQRAVRFAYGIINNEIEDENNAAVIEVNKILKQYEFISNSQSIVYYIKTGLDVFDIQIAEYLIDRYKDKIFFNLCPQCNKLARTPYARQCRHCGCDWHDSVVAKFRIEDILKISSRKEVLLLGEAVEGLVSIGSHIDLQIDHMPEIKVIEYARKGIGEYLALGINVKDEQTAYLKANIVNHVVDILKKK